MTIRVEKAQDKLSVGISDWVTSEVSETSFDEVMIEFVLWSLEGL